MLALVAAALVAALGAFGYVKSGVYDVGAAKRHTKLTEWLTHETMIHSVKRHARSVAVPQRRFTRADLVAGFCDYQTHCAACHGAAAVPREQWVSGTEPSPPYLLDVQQRFTPPELFWIAKNGIKMTGMPAWGGAMSDAQIWDVVAWLDAGSKLPPQTYVRWRSAVECPPGPLGPSPAR